MFHRDDCARESWRINLGSMLCQQPGSMRSRVGYAYVIGAGSCAFRTFGGTASGKRFSSRRTVRAKPTKFNLTAPISHVLIQQPQSTQFGISIL